MKLLRQLLGSAAAPLLRGTAALTLGSAALLGSFSPAAHAVPSFARQTGQECAACHIGAFGPQLTPFGIRFKLNGYTESDGQSGHIPLSAMLRGSWTHTREDQAGGAAPHYGPNDNGTLHEA